MKRKSNFPRKEPRVAPWLFSHSWEQREVGEWGDFYYGKSAPKWSVSDDAPTPCIRYGELYTKFGCKVDRVYSYTNIPPEKLVFSKGTEVLVPRVGEDPMDYNHCTWLSLKGVAIGEMISVYNTQQNPLFTAIMFNATLQEEFAKRVEGGSVTNLYYDKLKNITVSFPTLAEQSKIAAVFENIDTLITLHQRVQCVTSLLISWEFDRFTIFWEQREFGEIVSEYVDPVSTPTKGYYRLGIKSHAKGTFHSYVRPGMELGTAQMHRVAANNFIVNITFGWEHAVAITTEVDAGKLVSHRFPQFSFSAGMVPAYFKYLILDEDFRHHLWLASPGGAGRNRVLKISEMLEYKFWVPSQEEQQKISILLTKLDDLITLHQREFTHTKPNTNYVKYYQRNRPLLCVLRSMDKSV